MQPARPRGFQPGAANYSAVRAAHAHEKRKLRTDAARRRAAEARARFNPRGVLLTEAGIRGPLSTREKALVLHAVRVRGVTQLQAAAEAGVSQQAVSRLLKRVSDAQDSGADSDADGAALPATPMRTGKRRSSGRPSLLTTPVRVGVRKAVRKDPFGNVGALHKALLEHKIDVTERTLRNWLTQLRVHTRATSIYADLNERLIHGLYNHIEAIEAALESAALRYEQLVYADQTPVFICAGHKTALGETCVFGDGGDAKGGKKIGNLWAVVTVKGCLRAWFTADNGDEPTTKQFFLQDKPPPGWINIHGPDGNIFDIIAAHGKEVFGRRTKMLLLIDRLGKSGASAYPVAAHHAPELRVRAHKAHVGLLMLPPKGALVNPIELWNMHVKNLMNALKPAGAPTDGWQQYIRGPRTKSEALEMLKRAVVDVDANEALLRWCYYMRAAGKHVRRRLEDHDVAKAVRAAREAQPVAPFDMFAAADAPRACMVTDHPYPTSAATAETYNVYFWLHHHLELHAGLPPPFTRRVDAADGSERECRLCKPTTKASMARNKDAVCCDTCPGLYHYECLGLAGPPAGAWKCSACVRGDVGPLRKWVKPKTDQDATKTKRKRRRAAESDAEATDTDAE